MIYVKSHFSEWHPLKKEQARKYVEFLLMNITCKRYEEKVAYIEEHKLRGITVKEIIGCPKFSSIDSPSENP